MPAWLFKRFGFVGHDLDTAPARAIHPGALTVRAWLQRQRAARTR